MNREIDHKLIANLASIKKDRNFIKYIFMDLDTDEKKQKMINYITENRRANRQLSISDIYIKEMQINGTIRT